MEADSLLGVWTGTIRNTDEWEMKMTISVLKPFEIGSTLGIFEIPMLPCSGTFRVVIMRGETIELAAENLQGDCWKADFDSIELLPDGALLFVSRGRNWEAKGILQRVFDNSGMQ